MGCEDPTAVYFLKFGWGDSGETKSSALIKAYMLRSGVSPINGISHLRDNKPISLESPN